jgi:hypothetical protein
MTPFVMFTYLALLRAWREDDGKETEENAFPAPHPEPARLRHPLQDTGPARPLRRIAQRSRGSSLPAPHPGRVRRVQVGLGRVGHRYCS